MALIQCPKCGKNISDTTKACIHCGCLLKAKKSRKINKSIVIIAAVVLIILLVILVIMRSLKKEESHTIQNTVLITLMEYSQSSKVKDMLGDNYEHNSYNMLDSTSDDYKDIYVGDLKCDHVQLSYDNIGNYKRVYIEATKLEKKEKDILVNDLIAQYGGEYDHEKDGPESYKWTISRERRVSIMIWSRDDGTYRVVINSFHQWP